MPTTLQIRIGPEPPNRLDKALVRDIPASSGLSRSRIARLIAGGAIRVNGVQAESAACRIHPGDKVTIAMPAAEYATLQPRPMELCILHEDEDLLVIDKPAGLVMHPAPGNRENTLVNGLVHRFGGHLSGVGGKNRPGIVHRIDQHTSGLVVVALNDCAHRGLARQFAEHTIEREYGAVVFGVPDAADPRMCTGNGVCVEPEGWFCISTRMGRHPTHRRKEAVLQSGGRQAVTRFRVKEKYAVGPAAALLTCRLETGRTHQIRVHLAHVGHPVVGDATYGRRRFAGMQPARGDLGADSAMVEAVAAMHGFGRQALHARVLGLEHPRTGEFMRFESAMPEDMQALLGAMRKARKSLASNMDSGSGDTRSEQKHKPRY